jgi:hypothetical protein
MGARIHFVFKEKDELPAVVLYSHWGEDEWPRDLAMALDHARPRWTDGSYVTRMIISYLMQDSLLGSTGFGIYAIPDGGNVGDLGDHTIIVDIVQETVLDLDTNVKADWDLFVQAYKPVAAEVGA